MSLIIRLRSFALVALLAMALGVTGFGHRAPSQQEASVQAFLAAGFGLPDLCGTSGPEQSAMAEHCPVCTVAGAALVPANTCLLRDADLQLVAVVLAPRARQTIAAVHDPAHAPRAPPLA
ncbi:MAG: hypothetical protein U0934_08325 [Pseudotabrizicola sp.]|uniref:hypothetical protein n=1 Tax=Pseudotabrizicola sp. TaxID=2939647 RepID=UPI0027257C7A|nr:hypothetical protein [Pseudotabrizicola sp.]MDO8881662.1 hypothetical protein [Pseudotabrizicola sp.]MDP2082541.1 hypothetical protein [Pseudotabrizicola sp.]MDZ7573948.1 hypothetical protein [Pseudotabrizicola sp.]